MSDTNQRSQLGLDDAPESLTQGPTPVPDQALIRVESRIEDLGGGVEMALDVGAVGVTLFDTPSSDDSTVTVVLPPDELNSLQHRALVRIQCAGSDERSYLGLVAAGPFYEPDGIRGDAAPIVTTAVRGRRMFVPKYHGRASIAIIGEEIRGTTRPPRFRPRPNSPVYALDEQEVAKYLNAGGDIQLGLAIGYETVEVGLPSHQKSVLPRHLGILGTTGGGKSTTVSRLIHEAQAAGMAIVVVDVEGEYSQIHEPTEDAAMLELLEDRREKPSGVPIDNVYLYHLIGRDAANPDHPHDVEFTLEFDTLSPDAVAEILGMNEAQQSRFLKAYSIAVDAMVRVGIITNQDRIEWDQLETGCPKLTLDMLYDVVRACAEKLDKKSLDGFKAYSSGFATNSNVIADIVNSTQGLSIKASWWKVQGMLNQLRRFNIFDNTKGKGIPGHDLVRPGQVSIIDLSDTDSPYLRNLAIAEVLRATYLSQESAVSNAGQTGGTVPRTLIIIEEAHEFVSAERIKQMPVLFDQITRIARRGRKRWLGLCFVSQSPQHLPNEILGLINNVVLHKLTDAGIIRELRRSIGGVDDGLWNRLPNLAPGQAIVAREGMSWPLLVAIDPTPCKLMLIE